MSHAALETVLQRNNFYRQSYHNLLMLLFLSLVVTTILVYFIVKYQNDHTKPFYFATDKNGGILYLAPPADPFVKDEQIISWAKNAGLRVYSYNHVDFRKDFQNMRQLFTSNGYKGFLKSLKISNNLDAVKQRKFVVSARLAKGSAPKIVGKGIRNGVYSWLVEMDLDVFYQNELEAIAQPIKLELIISRVNRLNELQGIAISQFVAQDR